MKKITAILIAVALLFGCTTAVLAAAGDTHPFQVDHVFHDGEDYATVVKTVKAPLTLTEGDEFWVENLSGDGTPYVYNYHIDGYGDIGRWWNSRSSVAGGFGSITYGTGVDADGNIIMYKNRLIALDIDNGGAVYHYVYQPGLIRRYVDRNGNLLTGESGTLTDKDGNAIANPSVAYYYQGTSESLKVPEIPGYELEKQTAEGDTLTYNTGAQCWTVRIDLHKSGVEMTFVYDKLCTVTYTDGVKDEEIFPDETTEDIVAGSATPAFSGGTPTRKGYTFKGWSPSVSDTVTRDVTYTALWEEEPSPVPPTGDDSRTGLLLAVFTGSLGALTALTLIRRRKSTGA